MSPLLTGLFIGGLGTTELLIILAVVVLLFGATKLPELARGSGRALRIFKAETKALTDSDTDSENHPVARTDADLAAERPATQVHVDPIHRA